MAILKFQKPDKVYMLESTDSHGVFEFRPLQPGYGMTVGNALRRVLLSSLEGFAITSVKITLSSLDPQTKEATCVHQEFSSIPGVMEDVTDIVLNLKKIRFKNKVENYGSEEVNIVITGKEQFVAGDMDSFLNYFQVLNKDQVICTMNDSNVRLDMRITIDKGRGYVPAEENKNLRGGIDIIAIDSIHTPIRNVKYVVENYRVEQQTDFEKLVLEIDTDGSIHPNDALAEAAQILIQHFMLFSEGKMLADMPSSADSDGEFDDETQKIRQLLQTKLVDLDLSVRALNCLQLANLETLGQVVTYHESELMRFRNFGRKSMAELKELIESKGLEFGMSLTKYKL